MRRLAGALAALLLAATPGLAQAGLEDELPLQEGRAAVVCDIAGILVHEGLLVIRCAKPTADGLRFFTVERDHRRYADILESANWALEKGRPVAILYATELRHNPGGCKPENCRAILGVERR
ncbi:MAG: hypothetical protein K0R83_947 [Caulobacter sp.]|nr:hypothetical protein [Caulobacter sp.]